MITSGGPYQQLESPISWSALTHLPTHAVPRTSWSIAFCNSPAGALKNHRQQHISRCLLTLFVIQECRILSIPRYDACCALQHPRAAEVGDSALGGHERHGQEHAGGPAGSAPGHQHRAVHGLCAPHATQLHPAGLQSCALGFHLRGECGPLMLTCTCLCVVVPVCAIAGLLQLT